MCCDNEGEEKEEVDGNKIRLDPLIVLPVEVSQLMLEYLGLGDLVRCSQVSRLWHHVTNYDPLWRCQCRRYSWLDTEMVDNYRTHRYRPPAPKIPDGNEISVESPCRWKINFERNYKLPRKWARGECVSYDLRVDNDGEVVNCLYSDGDTLAVGHAAGLVTVFDVRGLPRHLATLRPLLAERAVTQVRIDTAHLVVAQAGFIELYKRSQSSGDYLLVSRKSLELTPDLVEVWERLGGTDSEGFEQKYRELMPDIFLPSMQVPMVLELAGDVYCAVKGRHLIYSWCPDTGQRTSCLQLPGHPHSSLKDIVVGNRGGGDVMVHVIFYCRSGAMRVGTYSARRRNWLYDVCGGETRVTGLVAGGGLIVGAGRGGRLEAWEAESGAALAAVTTRQEHYVRPGLQVVVIQDEGLIAYADGGTVLVWDPRRDITRVRFNIGAQVACLRDAPFSCLLVFTHGSCALWHWPSATRLYTLYLRLQWAGDYSEVLYLDRTMILSKSSDERGVRMTTYC